MVKSALISGISGQDGSYLAELLLSKGYTVHGIVRRSSTDNLSRIHGILDQVHLHYGDLSDASTLARTFHEAQPTEVYNLAALSDVRVSFDQPEFSGNITGLGCTRMLELTHLICPEAKFYQAGSSEQFGDNPDIPCNEQSEFRPVSPYAAAKCYAHNMTKVYRDSYGMFAVAAVLFNHEGERRGADFVTQKIARGVANIVLGRTDQLVLGNLEASRDWGHARDFVHAMYLMLQADEPEDYVIGTGETHTVREFLDLAFGYVSLDWNQYVTTDPKFYRPVDPPVLLADASKARERLGWKPTVGFEELVHLMVDNALDEQ